MARPAQDEFETTTENAALVELLRRRIDAEGAISFHDFMETALYHPSTATTPLASRWAAKATT